jgi:acetyl-CoA acyltransferase
MKEAYIVDAVRSPIGNLGGVLSGIRADDLAAHVIQALLGRHPNLDPARIDDVVLGCANQAGEDNRNVARMALLLAGLPASVPGETVNRLCASGMSAVVRAGQAIAAGAGDLFVAGGVEHMTRSPWVMSKSSTPYGRDAQLFDSTFGWRFVNPLMEEKFGTDPMGGTAENLLETRSISREDQDRYAMRSQQLAAAAQREGRLGREIAAVRIPRKKQDPLVVDQDEFIKPGTTMEALSGLRPAFRKGGSVTAGNSSGLHDAAAMLVMCSGAFARAHGLRPLGRVRAWATVGVEPLQMGLGPVEATRQALARAQLSLSDIDLIELNDAFAAQLVAAERALGLDRRSALNPNGGCHRLGSPDGHATGARLALQAALLELHRRRRRPRAGHPLRRRRQGHAVVLERV